MGFSETDSSKCRRHPSLRQSPGVCSSCLREKLSNLSASPPSSFNRFKPKTIIVSHSSSQSSSPPSSTTGHRRNGSAAYVSVGLKKSRSVSCANLSSRSKFRGNDIIINDKLKTRVNNDGGEVEDEEGCNSNSNNNSWKKKNGFIKKFMNTTTKKTRGVLMHSKTMNERSLIKHNNNNNN